MTLIAWVVVLGLVGIQAVAAMRIVPVYMNYYSVKKIMEEVKADGNSRGASPKELDIMLAKRLNVNGIYDLQRNKEAFRFQKSRDSMKVILHYEARGPIYGNLEFVATFDHEIDIPNQ